VERSPPVSPSADLPSHAGADGDGSRVTRIDGRWRRTVVISAVTNDDVPDPAPDDDAVYRAHASELIAYATVLVGRDEARDVVTDAVLSAFASREWPTVRNRRAYLYRAVLNRAASHHRSVARRQRRERRAALRVVRSDDEPAGSVDVELALARLSAQQRAVVYLAYWQDQTPAQIADLLGVTEGTVRKQLARARQQLRRILDA